MFDLIGLLPTNHIIAYITMAYWSLWRKRFDGNGMIAQTTQNIWNFIVRKIRIYKKWQTWAIIWEISDSNLKTGRNGSKSGVSQIIRESWLPCLNPLSLSIHLQILQTDLHTCPLRISWENLIRH